MNSFQNEGHQAKAEALVNAEVVRDRLRGDERGLRRWISSNASFHRYLIGLKTAELDGTTKRIQSETTAATGNAKPTWQKLRGTACVVDASGIVMTTNMAKRLGYVENSK